ncbi:unnamed protein product [Sphagnum balticum]
MPPKMQTRKMAKKLEGSIKKERGNKDVVEEEGKDRGEGGHQVELEVKVLGNKEATMVSSKSRNNEHLKQPTLVKSFLK